MQDVSFAKDKLDLFPRVSLEESVKSTAEWFLTNG